MKYISNVIIIILAVTSNLLAQGKWKKVHDSEVGPGPRYGFHLVVDEARQCLMLFGGRIGGYPAIWKNDTWVFDLNSLAWSEKKPKHSPSSRSGYAMAYNPLAKRTVLHSGLEPPHYIDYSPSTWEWDGEDWQLITTSGPEGREWHRMVWYPVRKEMMIFGGLQNYNYLFSDTWIFKNNEWYRKYPLNHPRISQGYVLLYDTNDKRILMHGGLQDYSYSQGNFSTELFSWDGYNWKLISNSGPSKRAFHGAAYDTERRSLLLFGGNNGKGDFPENLLDDMWEFKRNQWKQVHEQSQKPSPRAYHEMVYDKLNKRIWLFGGLDKYGWNGELWYYTVHPEFDLSPIKLNSSAGTELKRGEKVKIVARIKNFGDDVAESYRLKFFLSTNKELSNDDIHLLSRKFDNSIRPNKSIKYTFTKRIDKSIAPGQYYLIVIVESEGIDLNKMNNIKVRGRPIVIAG